MKKIFILLLAVFLYGCNENGKNSIVESGTIESTEALISSQVSGRIIDLLKDEGERVKRGDTLCIIDTTSYKLQLNQAEAALKIAEAQLSLLKNGARKEDIKQAEEVLKQAAANFNSAKTDFERIKNLFDTGAVNKKQLDDAETRYQIMAAQYNSAKENLTKLKNITRPEEIKQAEANVEKARASVDLLKKSLNDCFVVSPIDGFVVKKFIEKGETVTMLSALFKVSDLSKVKMSVYIPETDLPKIKLGQKVDVTVDAYPDRTFEGRIIYISPEAEFTPKNIQTRDERTKLVFEVKIEIPNPEFVLKTGIPADATIQLGSF
ncbi:secretion protein HlyD [Melioribacter roseus P3M-2]|uniref:Secretion protein HlyD n=1 Tax=Melioribacter roseus (strain DSM 23840 / JCM 17771 / VKM B-2668 / P3M-2) TaxID=1191523 RepID=I6ZYT3_MELRP|nr:HlyD family efflux transporter periplasmic adaptor subunit [Melioribacter roseus]AFN74183.1 secretion protein HlyD [Melioribacter roseus P3M-2]